MALGDNLIAYWKLDETAGTNAVDAHSTYDGTYADVTVGATGKLNYAMNVNTTTGVMGMSYNSGLVPTGDKFTLSMWINEDTLPTTTARHYCLTNWQYTIANNLWEFRHRNQTGAPLRMLVCNNSDVLYETLSNTDIISTGNWYHIVYVHGGNGVAGKIYVNNSDQTASATTFSGSLGPVDYYLTFGNNNVSPNGTLALDGLMDEIGYWDRALTSDEVSLLYNSGNGLAYENFFTKLFEATMYIRQGGVWVQRPMAEKQTTFARRPVYVKQSGVWKPVLSK